jgi:hypothetical protein
MRGPALTGHSARSQRDVGDRFARAARMAHTLASNIPPTSPAAAITKPTGAYDHVEDDRSADDKQNPDDASQPGIERPASHRRIATTMSDEPSSSAAKRQTTTATGFRGLLRPEAPAASRRRNHAAKTPCGAGPSQRRSVVLNRRGERSGTGRVFRFAGDRSQVRPVPTMGSRVPTCRSWIPATRGSGHGPGRRSPAAAR